MIWQPKIGQRVKVNYKDKSMPLQGVNGVVVAVGGKKPKNALIGILPIWFEVVPRGNLNMVDKNATI
jgi:hypothetical protein